MIIILIGVNTILYLPKYVLIWVGTIVTITPSVNQRIVSYTHNSIVRNDIYN
jgi:hypothetical protein